jgi:carboxyl-terminal processing protease
VRALAPKSRESYLALYELARELRGNVPSNFTVTPAWRAAYRDRLAEAGVRVEPAVLAGATGMVDRMLEQRVASLAFGDSAAVRRGIPFDAPLRETLTLLRGAPTQRALLGLDAGVRPDRG